MEFDLIKLIAMGGDISTFAFLIYAWRNDKRVSKLEWQQERCCD